MWYLYIAQCGDGSLYTGITTNLKNRIKRHNTGRGSAYVRSKGSASLVYTEPWPDESAARRREIEIKGWSRQKKQSLLETQREAKRPTPSSLEKYQVLPKSGKVSNASDKVNRLKAPYAID